MFRLDVFVSPDVSPDKSQNIGESDILLLIPCGSLWYQLNATKIQLNDTIAQLNETTAQLNAIKPGAERLIAERDLILSSYTSLRKQINLRLGSGQDGQHFITPDEPEISAIVQEITRGYCEENLWKDYTRLFQWTMVNIKYSLDSPIPLLPFLYFFRHPICLIPAHYPLCTCLLPFFEDA